MGNMFIDDRKTQQQRQITREKTDYHRTVHRSPVVIIRTEYMVNLMINRLFGHFRLRRYKPTKSRLDFIRPLVAISDKPEFI